MTKTPLIAFRCRPDALRAALEADAGGNVTACATERESVANLAPELFSEFRSKCYTVRLTAADKCYTLHPSDSN